MSVSAIIAAGGRGTRLGGDIPKQLRLVAGRTLLERSLEPFDASPDVDEIVVVLPADLAPSSLAMLQRVQTPLRTATGGGRRQDSVASGLESVSAMSDVVVVHDAARPFCSMELIRRTVEAAREAGAAIAALPAQDTIKDGRREGVHVVSRATLPRDQLYLAQTPQAFRIDILRDAISRDRAAPAQVDATDEAALVERAGYPVRLVPGDPRNIKVTNMSDLELANRLVPEAASQGPIDRVGLGYDLHRLVEGRELVLGGVAVPGPRGLLGHSDGDAVCHAITDALLGAANAGDIGGHFPDDDPRWKDASSIDLLDQVVDRVGALGFSVGNVDVVVITEWPKIRPIADQMQQRLAQALRVEPSFVSVKGKTGEGVGEVGRGEALAVHAIASLRAGAPQS